VFVVGLPRSSTTLVAQILASYSRVFSVGEIKLADDTMVALGQQSADVVEGLRQLDRQTARRLASGHLERLHALNHADLCIVNKMPENYLYLGALTSLFPRPYTSELFCDAREKCCFVGSFAIFLETNMLFSGEKHRDSC
jgi:hypothetical protein